MRRAGAAVAAAALIVLAGAGALGRAVTLFPGAIPPHPFVLPSHALLLYIAVPLVVVAAMVLMVAPGVFVVLAMGRETRLAPLMLKGFGVSFVLVTLADSAVKLVAGRAASGLAATLLFAALAAAGWLVLARRAGAGLIRPEPLEEATARRRLVWMVVLPALVVAALLPSLFWQDLTADGFEAVEIGRSLGTYLVPRYANNSGTMGLGIGMVPMAYVIHWFQMLFGVNEATARLPLALYLPLVFAALVALAELRAAAPLRAAEEWVIALALVAYTVTMALNASYDSYGADASSPAAHEGLTAVCAAATVYFLLSRERGWFLLFAGLGFLARPTGLLLVLLLGAVVVIAFPAERRGMLRDVALALGLSVVVYVVYERLFVPWAGAGIDEPGYPTGGIVTRFRYLSLFEPRRLAWAAAPGGFLPWLALVPALLWRRRDPVAFTLAAVTVLYFGVFAFPAFTNLHHFVPAMILPIPVLWRVVSGQPWRARATWVAAAGAAVGLWLAIPRHVDLGRAMRTIGAQTDYRIGAYGVDGPEHRLAIRGRVLLQAFFPADWDVRDPSRERVGGAHYFYYAIQPKPPGTVINYLVLPPGEAPPEGFTLLRQGDLGAAYVRDSLQWHAARFAALTTGYRSRLYEIERETLFQFRGIRARHFTVDVVAFLRRLRS